MLLQREPGVAALLAATHTFLDIQAVRCCAQKQKLQACPHGRQARGRRADVALLTTTS